MKTTRRLGVLLVAGMALTACTSIKSYVHPMYQRAVYADIKRPAQPVPIRVQAEFLRNGQRVPEIDRDLAGMIRRVTVASGVFVVTNDAAAPLLDISANNIADGWAAKKAGFFTSLRFGARGQMVNDDYHFVCRFTDTAGTPSQTTYWHEIHTSAGDLERLTDQQVLSPQAAFGQVVEDVVLTCIKHLQDKNLAP